ncbi:MAG: cysteine--tRNA ligase, partial [Acidobacteriaceae bacterium]
MSLRLYNTLSGQIEELTPQPGQPLGMYACGPTVYDYGHIGNFRTFIHVDILRRFLKLQGMQLRHVMNITDVDDKIMAKAAAAGQSIGVYTAKYEAAFLEDLKALEIEQPEYLARATENIPLMVNLIEKLVERGCAYRGENGSYYFRIHSFPGYGKLSKKDLAGMEDGARVDVDEYDKDSARDFALWKAAKPGEFHWDTDLGPGRPGWHIECSAMATAYLGETFDLHTGGEDLMFPHHENEIAQSESASGKAFARHWMHIRFLLVEGKKMSKSLGNFYTLRDLLLRGYKASAIRFLLTAVPYRNQLNFTFEGLTESTNAVERLRTFAQRMRTGEFPAGSNASILEATQRAGKNFIASLEDDLNTAEARAAIFELVRLANSSADRGELKHDNVAPILD